MTKQTKILLIYTNKMSVYWFVCLPPLSRKFKFKVKEQVKVSHRIQVMALKKTLSPLSILRKRLRSLISLSLRLRNRLRSLIVMALKKTLSPLSILRKRLRSLISLSLRLRNRLRSLIVMALKKALSPLSIFPPLHPLPLSTLSGNG